MLRKSFHDIKEYQMKQVNVFVTGAQMVFAGIPQGLDEPANSFEFMGMYKSKYTATRVYKYAMEKVRNETIEAFEDRFRSVISEDKKLRREMRRYRELGCNPSLQLGISLDEFGRASEFPAQRWLVRDSA